MLGIHITLSDVRCRSTDCCSFFPITEQLFRIPLPVPSAPKSSSTNGQRSIGHRLFLFLFIHTYQSHSLLKYISCLAGFPSRRALDERATKSKGLRYPKPTATERDQRHEPSLVAPSYCQPRLQHLCKRRTSYEQASRALGQQTRLQRASTNHEQLRTRHLPGHSDPGRQRATIGRLPPNSRRQQPPIRERRLARPSLGPHKLQL